jgi:hypothetical protein
VLKVEEKKNENRHRPANRKERDLEKNRRRDFCEGDRGGSTYGKCVT